MGLFRGALLLTAILVSATTMGCSGKGGDKGKDAAVDVTPAKVDFNKGKDLAVDLKLDKTAKMDLPLAKDIYSFSGEWMPCYGSTGYDNTCHNYKTGFKCCRNPAVGSNSCPPGMQCGHWDCNRPDMGNSGPDRGINTSCPVGSYCVSPSSCWCTKSTGKPCGSCDSCSTTCKLNPKCPVKP